MQIDRLKSDLLPHLSAVGIFLVILILYFPSVFFQGKSLKQQDVMTWKGNSRELKEYRQETGEEALWTNVLFSGMPGYLTNTLFPGNLVNDIEEYLIKPVPHPARVIFLNMICFYFLLLTFGVRRYEAIIGSVAFAFGTFALVSLQAGHNTKIKALGYAPLVLAGIHLTYQNSHKWLFGAALTMLATGLEVSANHFQITYYLILIIVIYAIRQFIVSIKHQTVPFFIKSSMILLVAGIIGAGVNAGKLMVTREYAEHSIRGKSELEQERSNEKSDAGGSGLEKDYAFKWSNGIFETFTLIIPNYYGGASQGELGEESATYQAMSERGVPQSNIEQFTQNAPLYFGDQPFTAGPVYFGAIVMFLFVLGMFVLEKTTKWWLFAATVLGIMLSWGDNFKDFNYLVFDYLPGYDKFRAVTMTLVISQICVVLTASLTLKKLFEESLSPDFVKHLLYSTGITAGFCLLVILFAGFGSFESPADQRYAQQAQWLVDALHQDRESMVRSDAFRSMVLILISATIIYLFIQKKLKKQWAVLLIGLFIVGDLWAVDKRYLNSNNFYEEPDKSYLNPTPADKYIMQDTSYYRVFNLRNAFNESRTSYFHFSIGGHHGAKMQRYQDLIERHLSREKQTVIQSLRNKQFSKDVLKQLDVLNMLNAKYLVYSDNKKGVIKNPYAHGAAWFVENLKPVGSATKEISILNKIDPAQTAVVDTTHFDVPASRVNYNQTSVELTNYEPNQLEYRYNSDKDGVIVFSEIYYPHGWQAYIDGEKASHFRTNYVLRAMKVPSGDHKITFKFQPDTYYTGNRISLICSIIVLVVFVGTSVWHVRRTYS